MLTAVLRTVSLLSLVILGTLLGATARGQWVQTNAPYIQSVHCFAISGSTVFAGAANGVFFSTDNGSSWTAANTGLTDPYVNALAIHGTTILAGTSNGLFRSTNNGANWTAENTGLTHPQIEAVTSGGSNFFLANSDSVFSSTDDGMTWNKASSGLRLYELSSLISDGTTVLAGNFGYVYRSTDQGGHWTLDTVGMPYQGAHSFTTIGSTVFAINEVGVFRSTFDGVRWDSASGGLAPFNLQTITSNGSLLIVGSDRAFFLSSDSGTHWKPATTLTVGWNARDSALVMMGSTLIAGCGAGIYVSSDSGATWKSTMNAYVNNVVVSNGALYAGTSGGIFRTTDNGISWKEPRATGWPDPVNASLFAAGNTLIAQQYYDGPYGSTDGGVTWSWDTGGAFYGVMLSLLQQGTDLYAGGTAGVFHSSTDGVSWENWSNGLTLPEWVTGIVPFGTDLFLGGNNGMYVSHNGGDYWIPDDSGIYQSHQVEQLVASGSTLIAAIYRMYRSNDAGASWQEADNGLTRLGTWALATYGSMIFDGTDSGGVFLSTNKGSSWTEADQGLPKAYAISSFAFLGKYVFASTLGGGVWKRPIAEFSTSVEAARDTQTMSLATSGTKSIVITGDTSGYTVHRIDFENTTNAPIVVDNAALTTTNNIFEISQIWPGIPDSLQPGEKFSLIIRFYGNRYDTVSRDTVVLTIGDPTSFYVYLKGNTTAGSSSSVAKSTEVSGDFRVYPNPFTQSTTIIFSTIEQGYADVRIVNQLGAEVARIFSGELSAGDHSFAWSNTTGLPAGMYECVVRMNGQTHTIPIVLSR
jgi:hypothetical protein